MVKISPIFVLFACQLVVGCEEKARTVDEWVTMPVAAKKYALECQNKYGAALTGIPNNCLTAYEAVILNGR